jgi:UDP-N-acetylenolpyruvoylglucosamine reductase
MSLNIQKNIPLASYTTLHLGGVADYLVEVSSVEELRAAVPMSSLATKAIMV